MAFAQVREPVTESCPSFSVLAARDRRALRSTSTMLGSLVFLYLFFVSGCASQAQPVANPQNTNPINVNSTPLYVTLPVDDTASEYELVQWLRAGGAYVKKDPNGDDRVFDSPACREILVRYRRMLRVRLDLIAQNVANMNTTRDAHGAKAPYRRKLVIADASGTYKIVDDPSPLLVRHEPGNSDADINGNVQFPNVDLSLEQVNALQTSKLYRMVTQILMRFDPTYVDVFSSPP